MILALTTITHQLFYLPKAILAAVVINALGPMLEFKNGLKYYKLNKGEFLIWLATFVVCLLGGMYNLSSALTLLLLVADALRCISVRYAITSMLDTLLLLLLLLTTTAAIVSTITTATTTTGAMYGIYTGVGLALLYVLVRASTSKTVVLGRLPGTSVYRNIERFSEARETPGVKIVRQDGSLNFACYEKFVATLHSLATKDIHTIIVDASSINTIDSSSMKGLLKLVDVSTQLEAYTAS